MEMRMFKLLFLAFCGFIIAGCQNDNTTNNDDVDTNSNVSAVVNTEKQTNTADTLSNMAAQDTIAPINATADKNVSKTQIVSKSQNEEKISSKAKTKKIDKPIEPTKKEAVETAEDLSAELNNEVNRQANPDNYNGVAEVKKEYNVNLIPVFSDADLAKYYVQVAIKVHKLSNDELSKMFSDSETVYVVQFEGLYNYCLGKFDKESQANDYKKQVDKKYKFKDTEVKTYKQAW